MLAKKQGIRDEKQRNGAQGQEQVLHEWPNIDYNRKKDYFPAKSTKLTVEWQSRPNISKLCNSMNIKIKGFKSILRPFGVQ